MPDGYQIVILAIVFVVVFLGVVWAARRRARRLAGTLTVYLNGRIIHEVLLSGRRLELDPEHAGLSAQVTPLPRDRDGRARIAILATNRPPGRPVVIASGQGHEVGELFVEYQDDHSRTVARIMPEQAARPRRRAAEQASPDQGAPEGGLGRHRIEPTPEDRSRDHAGAEGELTTPPPSQSQGNHGDHRADDKTHRDPVEHKPPPQPPE